MSNIKIIFLQSSNYLLHYCPYNEAIPVFKSLLVMTKFPFESMTTHTQMELQRRRTHCLVLRKCMLSYLGLSKMVPCI